MGYGNFKYSPRRTATDEVLHDKVFSIAKMWLLSTLACSNGLYIFFWKKNFGCAIKSQTVSNQQFAKNLPKPENEKYTNLLKITFGVLI